MKRLATILVLIALALPATAPAQDDEAPRCARLPGSGC